MQKKKRMKQFFLQISFISKVVVVPVTLLLSFNLVNRMSALYIWMSTGFVIYLTFILKSIYQEERPYWKDNQIDAEDQCGASFGNPSGHCLITTFVLFTAYLNQYYEVGKKKQFNSIFCTGYIIKMALSAGLVIYTFFLVMSRVYLGQNSYN